MREQLVVAISNFYLAGCVAVVPETFGYLSAISFLTCMFVVVRRAVGEGSVRTLSVSCRHLNIHDAFVVAHRLGPCKTRIDKAPLRVGCARHIPGVRTEALVMVAVGNLNPGTVSDFMLRRTQIPHPVPISSN